MLRRTLVGVGLVTACFATGGSAQSPALPGSGTAGSIRSETKEVEIRATSDKGQSQVVDKQQVSYRLEVDWSLDDKGYDPGRDPVTLSTPQHPCRNPAHKAHSDCGPACSVHRDSATQTGAGGSLDLPDAMAAAHRDSLAQNREIGSADLSFESASSDIRKQVRAWAERSVTIRLRASGVSCTYTTADFRFRRYELKLSWKWYRTTSHLVKGQWTPPLEEQLSISGSPTEAVVMVAWRIDTQPVSKRDVLLCRCGKAEEPPPTPPSPQTKTGNDNRTPTYSGLGVNPRPGQTTAGTSSPAPKGDQPKKDEPKKDEPKKAEPPPPTPPSPPAKTGKDGATPPDTGLRVNPQSGQATAGGPPPVPKGDQPKKDEGKKTGEGNDRENTILGPAEGGPIRTTNIRTNALGAVQLADHGLVIVGGGNWVKLGTDPISHVMIGGPNEKPLVILKCPSDDGPLATDVTNAQGRTSSQWSAWELGGSVIGSFAPIGSDRFSLSGSGPIPIPRFTDTSVAGRGIGINICRTTLLYPFVTNQAGFDTGLAISNTTADPFGSSDSHPLPFYNPTPSGGLSFSGPLGSWSFEPGGNPLTATLTGPGRTWWFQRVGDRWTFSSEANLITGAGPGGGPHVRVFEACEQLQEQAESLKDACAGQQADPECQPDAKLVAFLMRVCNSPLGARPVSDRTTGTTAAASASEREAESHWRVVQEVRRTFDFGNGKALCPEWCQEAFDEARQAAQKAYYCQSFHCSKSETEAAESDAKAKLEAYAECVWKHCPPGSNQNIATGDAGGAIKPAGETVLTTPGFASPWRGNAGGRNFDFAGINPLRFSSGGFIPSDQWNQFSPPSASTASAQVGTPYQIIVITFIFDQFSPLWPTGQPALGSERREPSRGHPTFWAALGSLWDWLQPRRPASFRTEVGASMLTAFLPQAPPVRNEAPARPEVRIDHQEVGCAVAEQYPRLEACFSPGTRVGRAQVRFRSQGTEDWYYVDMNPDGQCLSGILPKPKPTLKEFEYYIAAIDRDFSEKRHPDSAPEGSHSVRIVTREGDCEKGTRMARALLRKVPSVVVGALRGTRSLVPGGFSPEGVVAAPPPLTVSVVATGASMGEVFQLQVVNHSSGPVTLAALDGLVLEPILHAPGTLIATPGSVATRPVHGYCVEFAKPPPPAGTLYRVADASVQQKFRATRTILRAGRKLALQGKLHPDSDPQSYLESIKQYAVWARMEGWDEKRFGEQFFGRTKKNVEAAGRAWTKEMDAAIRGVTPGRWRDISLVLEAAGSVK